MALMLQVVGVHAASMGQNVRRLLGDSELKIGRDSDNDWILPQSYVSRHQAVIRCVNGLYFLEQVEMTVFGPSVLTRQERFFIQTVFHRPQAENEAYRVASLAQHNPQIAQRLSLVDGLQHGTSIRVRLRADSRVTIDEPEQTLHWRNATVGVQFMVQIPRIDWRTDYLFVIEVEADGAPIGRCKFRLTTTKQGSPNSEPRACGKLNRYERVFLSYASEDESVVSNFAQVLEAQGLDYFLDVLSLRSGDDWQSKLKEHIERSDLFLLCWSRHAAQSAWVRKEIEWALSAQRREPTRRPDIRPLLLDGPPVPPPPPGASTPAF
jgi:TIR domain/FHA domain